MPIPIPIKVEEGHRISTIVEEDIESYSPERTQYDFFEELQDVPKEEWLTVANPNVSYNSTPDEREPKTPEHLADTKENRLVRSSGYRNDPDYSPVGSSDQSTGEKTPAEGPEKSETITLIKESPQVDGNTTVLFPDNHDSGFLDCAPQTLRQRQNLVTVCSDSSSSSEDGGSSASEVKLEVRESVERVVKKAFRRVNVAVEKTEKLNLYKASLSKSPNFPRNASTSRSVEYSRYSKL
jgi:hypothetical protein